MSHNKLCVHHECRNGVELMEILIVVILAVAQPINLHMTKLTPIRVKRLKLQSFQDVIADTETQLKYRPEFLTLSTMSKYDKTDV